MRSAMRPAILLAAILQITVPSAFARAEPSAGVTTTVVHAGSLSESVLAYGALVAAPAASHNIAVQFDAIVDNVMVHAGEFVSKGTPLIRLSTTPAAAAQFAQAQSAYSLAQSEYARAKRLNKAGLVSNDQLGAAQKSLKDARAQLDAQEKAGASTGSKVIDAPMDGVVTALMAGQGEQLPAGTNLLSISDNSALVVQLGLEPEDATRVAPGDKVAISDPLDGGKTIQGKLRSVGGMIDPQSRLVPAIAVLEGAPGRLPVIGTTMIATLSLSPKTGILVRRSAILEDAEGTYVFVDDGGKAVRRNVTILAETDTTSLVGGGIPPNAKVIVSGNAALEDGISVHEVSK